MATKKQTAPASAPSIARTARTAPVVVDIRGTTKIGDILTEFGKIREAKAVITLRFEVSSTCRMDTVPARVNALDIASVATEEEMAILARADEIRATLKDRAKLAARKRVGNEKKEVWTTTGTVKRG